MKTNATKITKYADFVKQYIVPIVTIIFIAGVFWSRFNGELTSHAQDLLRLDAKVEAHEIKQVDYEKDIASRLSSIETKLDYIIKALDKADK